ncbi:GNAT family N-acetyltransferase [Leucobacter coleopterorum]|uniref:GNAT family N-acetyltransferase n=1 Tax=Leucobacter coleopterorum TaxID=2714933 RepID=A0ABX6JYD5_9MICO|nr:GNAT family protein [Leucobacter coleopterorum]QIM19233.1 GNAT family N-acetyltransferase [Leucobacter coleopterorum]
MAPLGRPIEDPGTLVAGRVEVRLVRMSDSEPLRQLLADNRQWLQKWEATHPSGRGVVPGSVVLRPTIRSLRRQLKAGTGVPFVVRYDSQVVGQLSVSEVSGGALQSAQIGYWVSEHVAGLGITPVSVALVIDYLFGVLGLHRVEICIRPENTASLRVVEKLGMRYEGRRSGYIHIDGAWRDHECFALTRGEAPGGLMARLTRAVD